MSHLFQQPQSGHSYQQQPYGSSPYPQQGGEQPFFAGGSSGPSSSSYYPSSPGVGVNGNMGSMSGSGGATVGRMLGEGRWWEAFGTGGVEGEQPLLEGESRLSLIVHGDEDTKTA